MGKRLKDGAILQILLPKNLGFGYARYVDLTKVVPSSSFPDLIRVFNYRTETEECNLEELENYDYLIAPLFVSGLPPTIRKGIWKILDYELSNEGFIIPHFSRHEDWVSEDSWYYCIDADSSKKVETTLEKVKHLSPLAADGTGIIEIEIAMTFLIRDGEKVEDYFDLEEYFETSTYEKVQATPPYYSLPKETRDKVLDS
ncbi:MAG: Imm26 family immunity protein [Bacteroidota bacterium]